MSSGTNDGGEPTGAAVQPKPAVTNSLPNPSSWVVRPFDLGQVTLGNSVFREKRDRLLHFAREYGPSVAGGVRDDERGPDRMLRSFRVNVTAQVSVRTRKAMRLRTAAPT